MKKRSTAVLAGILVLACLFTACSTPAGGESSVASTSGSGSSQATADGADSQESSEDSQQPEATEEVELLVSAAASLTDVTEELAQVFQHQRPEIKLMFTYGSSGALQTQIEEGAPSDLFLSAAQKQMDALQEQGLILEDTRKDLLINQVVLIVPKGSESAIQSFEDCAGELATKIALGEPKSVPVGQYSEEIFNSLGILDAVTAKANYGADVRQVLTWVESGEVDCGVVYATDAAISDAVEVVCEAPEGSCQQVVYPAAVLAASEHPEQAKEFLDFLSQDEAAALFEKYGFSMA